jgi:hypothetical protein
MIGIKDRFVLVGETIARAVELMGAFGLSYKDVENRLKEAFEAIGLSQSSGGVSPRCFLYVPHYWEGIDLRKKTGPHQDS